MARISTSYRAARREAARARLRDNRATLTWRRAFVDEQKTWQRGEKLPDATALPKAPPKTAATWSDHPGANPAHNPAGRERSWVDMPDGTRARHRGPRNPSRWIPHDSNAAAERRLRQKFCMEIAHVAA